MSKFYNLSDDAIEKFNDVFRKKAFSVDVRFQFVGIESQKSLIKISKIADQFAFILDKGVVGSELSIKTAGAAQQGPSLQDVVVVLNRIDAKLSQISSSSDNISRYVNEIRTPKAQIKKK